MRFFDRYGREVQEGDVLQNLETGNVLKVQSIDEDNVFCTIVDNPYSPLFCIPISDDGYNFVRQVCQ